MGQSCAHMFFYLKRANFYVLVSIVQESCLCIQTSNDIRNNNDLKTQEIHLHSRMRHYNQRFNHVMTH